VAASMLTRNSAVGTNSRSCSWWLVVDDTSREPRFQADDDSTMKLVDFKGNLGSKTSLNSTRTVVRAVGAVRRVR
jgi:hypothetical protein